MFMWYRINILLTIKRVGFNKEFLNKDLYSSQVWTKNKHYHTLLCLPSLHGTILRDQIHKYVQEIYMYIYICSNLHVTTITQSNRSTVSVR